MADRKLHIPTPEEDVEIEQGIKADDDSRELSDEEFSQLQSARAIVPEIVAAYESGALKRRRGQRGPQKKPTKEPVYIRFSAEVLAHFRATGRGWQARMDEALKEWIAEHDRGSR